LRFSAEYLNALGIITVILHNIVQVPLAIVVVLLPMVKTLYFKPKFKVCSQTCFLRSFNCRVTKSRKKSWVTQGTQCLATALLQHAGGQI